MITTSLVRLNSGFVIFNTNPFQAYCAFNDDMESLIGSLEKVTYMLKGDTTQQKQVAEILYGKQTQYWSTIGCV